VAIPTISAGKEVLKYNAINRLATSKKKQ